MKNNIYILGIESSCDDTAAAVLKDNNLLSNVIANQDVHQHYGGVVPELASRAHQQNIVPTIHRAISLAKINKNQLNAIAFTNGPGLLGSLLVGVSFAKSFAYSLGIPLIATDHLQSHVLAHFIQEENKTKDVPNFPFLCLLVSGGHSQIVRVDSTSQMTVIGSTIDDAAGEAFDKTAKIMGLTYPGGPLIDKYAKMGDENKFTFSKPRIKDLDYSFSGLKTSVLYFLRDQIKINEDFIEENKYDIAASVQKSIVDILLDKLYKASLQTGIKTLCLAGGVSANSGLRNKLTQLGKEKNLEIFVPEFNYTTDNAAMIAINGYYKYLNNDFADLNIKPYTRKNKKYNT